MHPLAGNYHVTFFAPPPSCLLILDYEKASARVPPPDLQI